MTDQKFYEYQHIFKPSAYRNAKVAKAVQRRLDELDDVYKFGLKDIATIDRSRHLTKDGKVDAYRKTGAEVASLLKPIENTCVAYDDRIREARDAITPKPHDRNEISPSWHSIVHSHSISLPTCSAFFGRAGSLRSMP